MSKNIKEIEDDERLSELFGILRKRDANFNSEYVQTDVLTALSLDGVCLF